MTDMTVTAAKTEAKPDAASGTKDSASTDTKTDTKTEVGTEAKDTTATDTKTDAGSGTGSESLASDAPPGYSRGENQKLVTDAYRKNWDAIFGNKSRDGSND